MRFPVRHPGDMREETRDALSPTGGLDFNVSDEDDPYDRIAYLDRLESLADSPDKYAVVSLEPELVKVHGSHRRCLVSYQPEGMYVVATPDFPGGHSFLILFVQHTQWVGHRRRSQQACRKALDRDLWPCAPQDPPQWPDLSSNILRVDLLNEMLYKFVCAEIGCVRWVTSSIELKGKAPFKGITSSSSSLIRIWCILFLNMYLMRSCFWSPGHGS